MSEVPSTFELKRGTTAPAFDLPEGGAKKKHTPASLIEGNEALVVIFACNHCPFVKHLASDIGLMAKEYGERAVQFVAINSNDTTKNPDDAPDKMKDFAKASDWKFPYLVDDTQETAKAYSAACTPDFFVFNKDLELTYTGQYDGSRPGNSAPITGADLRAALEMTLKNGKADSIRMRASTGCNIKWKKGKEPAYFNA